MQDRLDIIIFGATGFTGKFTLPQVYKLGKCDGKLLTWGIAGRSKSKLNDVLQETSKRIGVDNLNSIPIIIADINDEQSIRNMTAQAKIIINCCGPYNIYGEIVVKSCIETGTHHIDVSGEVNFIETIEAKYNEAAKEKGVYIISACGFDCVASDLGLIFLEQQFDGIINSAEIFVHGFEEGEPQRGAVANLGTWNSAINVLGNFFQIFLLRKWFIPDHELPTVQPKLWPRLPITRVKIADKEDKWILPFPSTDCDVIKRSQKYFYKKNNKRPIQVYYYMMVDSLMAVLKCTVFGLMFFILSQFKYGRTLLMKNPDFFSAGLFSTTAPSEDTLNRSHFSLTFLCKGWSKRSKEILNECKIAPDKEVIARVSGVNPGYGFTCVALTLSAVMILTQPQYLPDKGGVYTTAAAFSKTTFIDELKKNGTTIEIISSKIL